MEQPRFSFIEPKRKRQLKSSAVFSPFPVPVASIVGLPASISRWNYFTGRLAGGSVYVDDQASASLLYEMVSASAHVELVVDEAVVD